MIVRCLKPTEENLFRQAYEWTANAPIWWKAMDSVFHYNSFEDYYSAAFDESHLNYGVFDEEMFGLISLEHAGNGVFEVHVSAKRGANLEELAEAAHMIRDQVFRSGAQLVHGWVAKFNRGVIRLGKLVGFRRDGVSMFRGQCRGRVIEWVHLITTRAEWESL